MRAISRILATTFLTFFLLATLAFPQGAQTGGITGVVLDATGATVQFARVDIYNEETEKPERSLTTDADGNFTATLLPPGIYRIQITATGFKQYRAAAVSVRLNETTRHDAALVIGGVNEIVQVEATPAVLNTTSATTGQPVDSRTLRALPLPVPNFLFLLTLSPGTAGEPPDVRNANRGIVDINVNGQRTTNNSVALEGINVNDFNLAHFDTIPLPNPNTIQEFKVATSLYDASIGSKGGGALSLVLKSGTKDLHAEAYLSHRNDALNANEYFRNAVNSPRARLLQNVFGASGSGPLWILGGNWFANYQGVRARNGIDPNGSTLNPLIQAFPTNPDGSTSAALLASAFNLSPAQIDPIAVNILNLRSSLYSGQYFIPRPGQPGCQSAAGGTTGSFRCAFSQVAPITDNQYTISYDRFFRNGSDKISGRWFWDNGDSLRPYGTMGLSSGHLAFPQASIQKNRFLSLTHTHIFSPTVVNEFRFGFNRFVSSFVPNDPINLNNIGATRPNEADVPGMYYFAITGLFSAGTGINDERATVSNTFYWSDTLSMTKGRHTIRAGGDVSRYQLNRSNRFANRGALTFGATTGAGNEFTAFQNFLQGRITGLQSAAGDPQRYFRSTDVSAFFQDDWKITPQITLNLGIRWEGLGFANDKFYRQNIYDPLLIAQGQNPFLFPEKLDLAGFRGTPGVSDCALKSCFDSNNFGPRIGFAWDVFGNQKTVVRGGYGIYYQRLSNQNILQGSLGPPFFLQDIDSRPRPASFQLRDPLAGQPPTAAIAADYIPQLSRFAGLRRISGAGPLDVNDPGVAPIFVNEAGQPCNGFGGREYNCSITLASFASVPFDAYAPYTQQFNLGVQRDLGSGWSVEAGYVGTRYIGGLGVWDPYLAQLGSPSNPITVRDINGNSYSITTNTVNNEALRHQILGLSRARGARFTGNIGQGTFHSGQFSVLRRFSRGLYLQAAYTLSKTIDNVSGSQSIDELNVTRAGQGGSSILNFGNDPQANRALGDFDRRHRFVVSFSWDLPIPKTMFLDNQIFQGWSLSGIVTYQSGLPFSSTDSTAGGAYGTAGIAGPPLGTGVFTCGNLEDAYTSGSIQDRLNAYLNVSCFTPALIVPFGTAGATGYGTTPRNAFRGPFQQNWDFSLLKKITFLERHDILFRADFFNLFNHPVFRAPSAINLATPATFGQITETAIPARLIQFGLKYQF
jgi:hypothetical protein